FDFVIYDDTEQYFEPEIKTLGGRIHRIPRPGGNILVHLRAMNSLLKRYDYDVMHSHTAHHSGLISLVAWANRIPLRIAHARTSGASASHGMVRKLHRVTGKWLMRFFTTHRIAVSKESSEFIFGTSKNVIRLPNAIDIKHYLT